MGRGGGRESAKVQSAKGLRFALSFCSFGRLLLFEEVYSVFMLGDVLSEIVHSPDFVSWVR